MVFVTTVSASSLLAGWTLLETFSTRCHDQRGREKNLRKMILGSAVATSLLLTIRTILCSQVSEQKPLAAGTTCLRNVVFGLANLARTTLSSLLSTIAHAMTRFSAKIARNSRSFICHFLLLASPALVSNAITIGAFVNTTVERDTSIVKAGKVVFG